MPYRDAIPNVTMARGESRVGARIAGVGALVIVFIFLQPFTLIPPGTSAYWVLLLARFAIVGGAIFFFRRTDDRFTRRALGVAIVFMAITTADFFFGHFFPPTYAQVEDRPSWAPPKYTTPPIVFIRSLAYFVGLAALAWAATVRRRRAFAYVATAFAAGDLFRLVMDILEFPWIQHFAPDRKVQALVPTITRLFDLALPAVVGLALLLRPPSVEREAAPPFRALDPLLASVTAISAMTASLGLMNEWLMLNRGEHDWGNWMVSSGTVRLELFEPMMMLFYGGLLGAAVLLTIVIRREGRGLLAIVGTALLALASLFQFLRGRLHAPIATEWDWENTQHVWALSFIVVGVAGIVFANQVATAVQVAGAQTQDDLVRDLSALGTSTKTRVIGALGLAMATPLIISFGDALRSNSTHESTAHAAAVTGGLSLLLALFACLGLRQRRYAVDETLRRLSTHESPSPASH